MALPFTDGASLPAQQSDSGDPLRLRHPDDRASRPVEAFEPGKNLWLAPRCSAAAIEQAILSDLMSDRTLLQRLENRAQRN